MLPYTPSDISTEDVETNEKDAFISDRQHRRFAQQMNSDHFLRHRNKFALTLQSIIIVILGVYIFRHQSLSEVACAKRLSPYSPYLESGDLEYEEFTSKNHLMQPSIYRGQPTPELEEAWQELWHVPMVGFPESKLNLLNKTDAQLYSRVDPQYGEGVVGYLDVFHQLHCLSMIRQYTYRNNYNYSDMTAFNAPEPVVRGHIDHCIETLRKTLMCTADVTPVVFLIDPARLMKPDFNIRKKCRNFGKIQEWVSRNKAYATVQIPSKDGE